MLGENNEARLFMSGSIQSGESGSFTHAHAILLFLAIVSITVILVFI